MGGRKVFMIFGQMPFAVSISLLSIVFICCIPPRQAGLSGEGLGVRLY